MDFAINLSTWSFTVLCVTVITVVLYVWSEKERKRK